MKTRQEIKELAKDAVSAQRGTAILIVLLVTLISGASAIGALPFIGWLINCVFVRYHGAHGQCNGRVRRHI